MPLTRRVTAFRNTPARGRLVGGRHALVAAARLGDQYDGYLAGAPGYRLPNAAVAQIAGAALWSPLATPGATVRHPMNPNATIPDLGSALTADERRTVAGAILARCDALDGARDGMVQAGQACQAAFDPRRDIPTCPAGRTGACLSAAQKDVLARVHAGPRAADGRIVYSTFPWDAGIAGANWAAWKFVNSIALDPLAIGTVFTVPPTPADPLRADVGLLLDRIAAAGDANRISGLALMTPQRSSISTMRRLTASCISISLATMKRLPITTPAAPIAIAAAICCPQPMPPPITSGIFTRCSATAPLTNVDSGFAPGCPPSSMPTRHTASTPMRSAVTA